jgi:hypothetical protein
MNAYLTALFSASLTMTIAACGFRGSEVTEMTDRGEFDEFGNKKPSGPASGEQVFVQRVYPLLTDPNNPERCSNCHAEGTVDGPVFLSSSPHESYKMVREYNEGALADVAEINLLLIKGQHEGPMLTGEQRGAIREWLDVEHGRGEGWINPTLYDELENFAACMNREEFKGLALDQLFQTPLSAIPSVSCDLCHSLAAAPQNGGGFVLDPDGDITFDHFKQYPGVMKLVTGDVIKNGVYKGLRESLRIVNKGNELNLLGSTVCPTEAATVALVQAGGDIDVQAADYCHPNYTLPLSVADKLHQFVDPTRQRAMNEACSDNGNPLDPSSP